MAALTSFSTHLILRSLILRRATQPSFHSSPIISLPKYSFSSLRTTPSIVSTRFIYPSPASSLAAPQQLSDDVALLDSVQTESDGESSVISASDSYNNADISEGLKKSNLGLIKSPPPPTLSVKEKKELASYAHGLGKKLKSQQVGKSGVTDTVITALIETLEANELLKLKIHGTCPGEMEDVVRQLEKSTGSVVVGQIGRTVILYRPSLTKLQAEEKKKKNQVAHLKRLAMLKRSPQSRRPASESEREPRQTGRGRRGSSKF